MSLSESWVFTRATWNSSSFSVWRSLQASSLGQACDTAPKDSTCLREGSWGSREEAEARRSGSGEVGSGLRHAHLPPTHFQHTAHTRPRIHTHTEQRACLHQEKLCLEPKLVCVNYSDNEFARCIRAGPPARSLSTPSPVSLRPQPPPTPPPRSRVGSGASSHFPASLAPKCILNITPRRDNY